MSYCTVLAYFSVLVTICPWLGRFDILLSVAERSLPGSCVSEVEWREARYVLVFDLIQPDAV